MIQQWFMAASQGVCKCRCGVLKLKKWGFPKTVGINFNTKMVYCPGWFGVPHLECLCTSVFWAFVVKTLKYTHCIVVHGSMIYTYIHNILYIIKNNYMQLHTYIDQWYNIYIYITITSTVDHIFTISGSHLTDLQGLHRPTCWTSGYWARYWSWRCPYQDFTPRLRMEDLRLW